MNWRDVRVGIIGLGNISRVHIDSLLAHGVAVVGGMDTDPRANQRFTETYGVDIYDELQELLEVVDAVVVATPNCHHEEYAVAALDAGCSVLLEKPLAHDLESAENIAEAARWSDGFCMVGFNNRFANSVRAIKAFQRTGRFGDVRHIEANYIRRRGVPGCGSWFTDSLASGGGALIDIGVHAIDLALFFLDFPEVVEVTATTRSNFGSPDTYTTLEPWETTADFVGYDVDDSVTAFIRTTDDTTVNLEVAWATNRPSDDTLIIRGTEAGACFDRENDTLTLYESGIDDVEYFANTEIVTRRNDTLAAEQRAFLQAVADGEPPEYNTIEQGVAVQRVIDAIYRSAKAGRAIRLKEPTPIEPDAAGRIVYVGKSNGVERRGWQPLALSAPSRRRQNGTKPRISTANDTNNHDTENHIDRTVP